MLLIGNVAADTPESVLDGLAFEDNGQAFTRDLTQVTEKGTETTARIHGKLGGLVLTGNDDGTKNVEAGLVNESLELLTTYSVSDSGTIALKVFGSGSLAVYGELRLENSGNAYTGGTTVSGKGAVLTLGADGALGQANSHTGELSVTDGAKVDFGSTSQTIGSINAFGDNALESTGGTLTIASGGTVSGANSDFNTDVELLDGSADLTLTNVDALGAASITTLGSNTDLVLSGADGGFDNIVAGSGGLSIVNGAKVTLEGDNTFAGSLKVDGSSSVAATGDVFSHIGDGSLELEGSANFTQTTFADEHPVWKWDRTVNGSGNLSLSTDGAHELVLESGLGNFKGNLTLGNLQMTLSSGGNIMQSLTALSSSKIKSLILDTGADLHLEGATTLSTGVDNFGVTMKSGGSFVFEGIAVPGSEETATNTTHLTIDGNLTLESGFELSLSTEEDAKVDPTNGKSLLERTATRLTSATSSIRFRSEADRNSNLREAMMAPQSKIRFLRSSPVAAISRSRLVSLRSQTAIMTSLAQRRFSRRLCCMPNPVLSALTLAQPLRFLLWRRKRVLISKEITQSMALWFLAEKEKRLPAFSISAPAMIM